MDGACNPEDLKGASRQQQLIALTEDIKALMVRADELELAFVAIHLSDALERVRVRINGSAAR